jgi:hypothetical protein
MIERVPIQSSLASRWQTGSFEDVSALQHRIQAERGPNGGREQQPLARFSVEAPVVKRFEANRLHSVDALAIS